MESEMEGYFLSLGLGYLVGLGVFGYFSLLKVINNAGEKRGSSKVGARILAGIHFVAGLSGILYFPSVYVRNNIDSDAVIENVIFAVTLLLLIVVVLRVAYKWDRMWGEETKSKVD